MGFWLDIDVACSHRQNITTGLVKDQTLHDTARDEVDVLGFESPDADNDTSLLDQYHRFEYVTEWYGMTGLCGFGILFNVVSMLLVSRDQAMRRQTKRLLHSLLCLQTIYMICVIGYVLLRHTSEMTSLMTSHRLRITSYVSTLMSSSQMAASFAIYVLATDVHLKLTHLYTPSTSKRHQIKIQRIKWIFLMTVCGSLLFHLVYLPEIRVLLYRLDPAMFDPCMLPLTKQWQFVKHTHVETDPYYVLYYGLLYLLLVYALPFYLVACRNKDAISLLLDVNNDTSRRSRTSINSAMESCHLVTIICNVYLATAVPKFVILLFKMFAYVLEFAKDSHIFFVYANTMANLVSVFGAGLYIFIFLLYSTGTRDILCRVRQLIRNGYKPVPLNPEPCEL